MEKVEKKPHFDTRAAATRAQSAIDTLRRAADDLKLEFDAAARELALYEKIDIEELQKFLKEPWCILPKSRSEWWVVVPRWVGISVGFLERATETYNIFRVDRYSHWFGNVPEQLREALKLPEQFEATVTGNELRTTAQLPDSVRKHLAEKTGPDTFRVTRGHEFDIIAALIEAGSLPFTPKPVAAEDLRDIKLQGLLSRPRGYQMEAWKRFLETGAVLVCWPFGMGKTFLGLYAIAHLKGPKLIVVPSTTLVEQWEARLVKCLDPGLRTDVTVCTYHAWAKIKDRDWAIVIFDECVEENEFVLTPGGYSKAKDLSVGDKVVTADGEGTIRELRHSKKRCIRVRTEYGVALTCSEDHPVATASLDGVEYRKAKTLRAGDIVVEVPGKASRPKPLNLKSYLIGLFAGDGCRIYRDVIRFGVRKDRDFWQHTIPKLFKDAYPDAVVKLSTNCRADLLLCVKSQTLCGELDAIGLTSGKKSRRIPWPEGLLDLGSYLGGIYDAEGSFTYGKPRIDMTAVGMLRAAHRWLRDAGIPATLCFKKALSAKHGPMAYFLVPRSFAPAFARLCPSLLGRKRPSASWSSRKAYFGSAAFKLMRELAERCAKLGIRKTVLARVAGIRKDYLTGTAREGRLTLRQLIAVIEKWKAAAPHIVESVGAHNLAVMKGWYKTKLYAMAYADPVRADMETYDVREELRERFLSILEAPGIQQLGSMGAEPLFIKSIEACGERRVVNYSVTPGETFVAGGLLTHNCHYLPASTFSRMSTLRTKYRIGLTATPYREDGRQSYIVALTGYPVGVDWVEFIRAGLIKKPDIEVRIVAGPTEKIRACEIESRGTKGSVFIFCDGLAFGASVARRLGVPHVHGQTTERLKIIENNRVVVLSRVGDEGLSVPNLQKTIEVDYLGGSRRQESQRVGRLFHDEGKGEHLCLMTRDEFDRFQNRFLALEEKGFKVTVREKT